MNANTKQALKGLAEAVEKLAQGTVHHIGMETATEICEASEALKSALDKDETIEQ